MKSEQGAIPTGPAWENAIVLQSCKPHHSRLRARLEKRHGATELPVLLPSGRAVTVQRNSVGLQIFTPYCGSAATLLAAVLLDLPLCRSLVSAPFIVHGVGTSLATQRAFVNAARRAHEEGATLKLSAPTKIRRALLDAVLQGLPDASSCLVTRGATRVFTAAAIAPKVATFVHSVAAAGVADDERDGHWHLSCREETRRTVICKAFFKMSELLAEEPQWRTALARPCATAAEQQTCVDIGAAPGGWTELLSRSGNVRVVAVDPADLVAEVAERANVHHLRVLLRDAASFDTLRAALPARGASFLVCDMNVRPSTTAEIIVRMAGLLAPNARVAVTLKITVRSKAARAEQEADAVAILAKSGVFEDIRVRWLFANTQHESTLTATLVR
jgi:23S rRNA U2552 (ribose-2'-O)-methylase RlmE/FtsJ